MGLGCVLMSAGGAPAGTHRAAPDWADDGPAIFRSTPMGPRRTDDLVAIHRPIERPLGPV